MPPIQTSAAKRRPRAKPKHAAGAGARTSRLIGVIADTHGLVRPEVLHVLAGVEHIVHAGDIGAPAVIAALRKLAPVTPVRGNNDEAAWADAIGATAALDIEGRRLFVIHDLKQLTCDPSREGIDAVISGHSHKACIEWRNGVLFLNPGSAGPRRFKLPVTVALLRLSADRLDAEIKHVLPHAASA
jgi:uncharacterized protein